MLTPEFILPERTINLNIGGTPVEVMPSRVPNFTGATIPIIRELSEDKNFAIPLQLSPGLKCKVVELDTQIESLKDAENHKTRDIILAVLKGAFLAAVLAGTIFAFITLASNPVGTALIAASVVAGVGTIITFGNTLMELLDKNMSGTAGIAFMFIAPFVPIVEVFANIYKLNSSIERNTTEASELLTSLSEFYTNSENMEKIKAALKKEISECEEAIKKMPSLPEEQGTIQRLKVEKETALRELEESIVYFTELAEVKNEV